MRKFITAMIMAGFLATAVSTTAEVVNDPKPAAAHPDHNVWKASCVPGVQYKAIYGNGDDTDYEYENPYTSQGHPPWSPRYIWLGYTAYSSQHPNFLFGAQVIMHEYLAWGAECGPYGYGLPVGDPFIVHSGTGEYIRGRDTPYGVAQEFSCGYIIWWFGASSVTHTC